MNQGDAQSRRRYRTLKRDYNATPWKARHGLVKALQGAADLLKDRLAESRAQLPA